MHFFLNILAFASIGLFVNGEEWCMSQFMEGWQYANVAQPFQGGKASSVTECMNRCLDNHICMSSEFQYNNGVCYSYNTLAVKTHYLVPNFYYSKPMENKFNPIKSNVAFKAPKKNGVCPPDQVRNGDTVTLPNGRKYSLKRIDTRFEVKEV
ncbi:Apple domain-containing protein [Caenorhabditis elegans]|uniref:Apple domain-containing protein n=1 Tax=Caenorhabditis elegans TaxID=6239 RepID=D0VWP5_CAEEL|nr:Apple domain-containing protein [Caenorhabditis elegans]CBH29672.1 Apple domain-containing protein [Caenorhabditis elegans]|eukprot:NP_001256748.1 Uncharacterized protein CELE_Y6G8.16 [Caenorhabditis elegans]